MTAARFTLTLAGLPLGEAQKLAARIDDDWRIETLAVAVNEIDEARGLWETVVYFEDEAAARAADAALGLPGLVSPLPDTDWVVRSLEGLAPVAAGRFFLHGSHDRQRRRAGGVSLEIDAGTAFGTGHHGTTEGCLAALDTLLKRQRPKRILDLGCGTGVLAIAAARALRCRVSASDIDPEAVRVTRRNAARNTAGPLLNVIVAPGLKHAGIAGGAPYDLIFANILARPLVALAQGLSQCLEPGGILILSGLTLDQCRWILAAYRNRGLVPLRRIARGNWAALVLTRPGKQKRPDRFRAGRQVAGTHGAGWEDA
ncbi:MAG TPA: 50S ribosomal protein L11 methyltransferase [Aestuariivirga sp.]|nr:50S ribosomal protein L11 methyltransferase [Aestuariivirga sp.]